MVEKYNFLEVANLLLRFNTNCYFKLVLTSNPGKFQLEMGYF